MSEASRLLYEHTPSHLLTCVLLTTSDRVAFRGLILCSRRVPSRDGEHVVLGFVLVNGSTHFCYSARMGAMECASECVTFCVALYIFFHGLSIVNFKGKGLTFHCMFLCSCAFLFFSVSTLDGRCGSGCFDLNCLWSIPRHLSHPGFYAYVCIQKACSFYVVAIAAMIFAHAW